jgi:hypothetical protein
MVDENLVGYLLKALDPVSEREVEAYLQSHPEAQRQLELLSRGLAPLAADRGNPESPPTLRVRTLARVAEYRCAAVVYLPQAPPVRSRTSGRSWWARADILVAACVLLLVLPFIPPGIVYVQQLHNQTACENNLRRFYQAFVSYSDHHNGNLPKVEKDPPRNFAGVFIPVLHDAGVLDSELSVACPANGRRPPADISLEMLADLAVKNPAEYAELKRLMACCYAYSLGYADDKGHLYGVRCQAGNDGLPIMADKPPFDQQTDAAVTATSGNSKNHGGRGQNVLYLGGYVKFRTSRNVGINGDDIYLNEKNQPFAGTNPNDASLGSSWFRPSPSDWPND